MHHRTTSEKLTGLSDNLPPTKDRTWPLGGILLKE